MIFARQLGKTETAAAMAFWGNFVFLVFALLLALAFGHGAWGKEAHPSLQFLLRGWVWPSAIDAALMCGCGVIAALGLTLLTQAYRIADATVVAPFEYTAMLWGVFWGLAFFGEWPDRTGWIGIATIVSAGMVVLWRETKRGTAPCLAIQANDITPES
jgi:drug/metabolite transporter (DMT)-like permease